MTVNCSLVYKVCYSTNKYSVFSKLLKEQVITNLFVKHKFKMFGFNHISIKNFRDMTTEVVDILFQPVEDLDEYFHYFAKFNMKADSKLVLCAHKWYNILQRQDSSGHIKDPKFNMNMAGKVMNRQQHGTTFSRHNIISNVIVNSFVKISNSRKRPHEDYSDEYLDLVKQSDVLFKRDPIYWTVKYDVGRMCLERFIKEIKIFSENDKKQFYKDLEFIDNVYIINPCFHMYFNNDRPVKRVKIDQDLFRTAKHFKSYTEKQLEDILEVNCSTPNTMATYIEYEIELMKKTLTRLSNIQKHFGSEKTIEQLAKATGYVGLTLNAFQKTHAEMVPNTEGTIETRDEITIVNFDTLESHQSEVLMSMKFEPSNL